jgi:dCTP deaminase
MILSNVEIWSALDEGRLVIDPEPTPRSPTLNQPNCAFDTHSVDLTLGESIAVPQSGQFIVDVTQPGSIAQTISNNSETLTITNDQPYNLKPNHFILAATRERIELPILDGTNTCLAARIEGKSSRARFGVLIHFTAPTVHPGFEGTLTLEMINLGPAQFVLKPGMRIAQLIVEEVKGCPNANPSEFRGQGTPAGL